MARITILFKTIAAIVLVLSTACGGPPGTGPPAELPPECEIVPGPNKTEGTIKVALLNAVSPEHAPRPENVSERLLFRLLYETLVTVDCLGETRTGLAQSWQESDGGRRWTFELREGARFWNGAPVTAGDVANAWQEEALEQHKRNAGIDSIIVVNDRVLQLYFERRHKEVPRVLSSPLFAVANSSVGSSWPLGSGPYAIATARSLTSGAAITTRPAFGAKGSTVEFVETSTRDARDLLESGVDVMVTADPAVIEYATGRPQFETVALPWDRTYVLLSTSRIREIRAGRIPESVSSEFTNELARGAVRNDAHGFESPSWWDELDDCADLSAGAPWLKPYPSGAYSGTSVRRVLYDAHDPIARDLAGRIVALATTDPATFPKAAELASAVPGLIGDAATTTLIADGVSSEELSASLRDGSEFAYVVSLPRRPPDNCCEARALINRVRWFTTMEDVFADALIPLVDARLHVIANKEKIGLFVDWYGGILLVNGKIERR